MLDAGRKEIRPAGTCGTSDTAGVPGIIKGLRKLYPDAHCELDHKTPLELLVATILSAQCTDKRVNMVTKTLFKKYRTAQDYARAGTAELEGLVRSTGFFRSKAKVDTHMKRLVITFTDADHHQEAWTAESNGKEGPAAVFTFTRKK